MKPCFILQQHLIWYDIEYLVFWCRKSGQNSNGLVPNGGAKCRWGRFNAAAVAENWRFLTRSQDHHTERSPCLFAARWSWCSTSRGFLSDSWALFSNAPRYECVVCCILRLVGLRLITDYTWKAATALDALAVRGRGIPVIDPAGNTAWSTVTVVMWKEYTPRRRDSHSMYVCMYP